jgi:membrane-associated phospholipid phosphatase
MIPVNKLKIFCDPLDYVISFYQIIIIGIIIYFFGQIMLPWVLLVIHFAFILFIIVKNNLRNNPFTIILKQWYPWLILAINFGQLPQIIPYIHETDIDGILIQLDLKLFSVHPTLWMENLHWPPLTEFLQFIYITFYFLPMILMFRLIRSKQFEEFLTFRFVFFLGFFLSYIGYILFPAIGPRFTLQQFHSFPLEGIFLTQSIKSLLNTLEQINRDAFPSGHTMMTLLSMIFALKYDKRLGKYYIPITFFMLVATVYLRYHYVVDLIGGIIFVFLSFFLYFISKKIFSYNFKNRNY